MDTLMPTRSIISIRLHNLCSPVHRRSSYWIPRPYIPRHCEGSRRTQCTGNTEHVSYQRRPEYHSKRHPTYRSGGAPNSFLEIRAILKSRFPLQYRSKRKLLEDGFTSPLNGDFTPLWNWIISITMDGGGNGIHFSQSASLRVYVLYLTPPWRFHQLCLLFSRISQLFKSRWC